MSGRVEELPSPSSASSAYTSDADDDDKDAGDVGQWRTPPSEATAQEHDDDNDDDDVGEQHTHNDDNDTTAAADAAIVVDEAECARLKAAGNTAFVQGNIDDALELYRSALRVARHKPHAPPPPPPSTMYTQTSAGSRNDNDDNDDDSTNDDNTQQATTTTTTTAAAAAGEEGDYTLTAQVYCNAGYCLMKQQQYAEAEELLSEAIRHDASYAKAHLRRADCYAALQKWSSAHADYVAYEKLSGGVGLDAATRARAAQAKTKSDEEMQKMLGELKELGNRLLGTFGLSTDNFKFDKDPATGGYSMRFEK